MRPSRPANDIVGRGISEAGFGAAHEIASRIDNTYRGESPLPTSRYAPQFSSFFACWLAFRQRSHGGEGMLRAAVSNRHRRPESRSPISALHQTDRYASWGESSCASWAGPCFRMRSQSTEFNLCCASALQRLRATEVVFLAFSPGPGAGVQRFGSVSQSHGIVGSQCLPRLAATCSLG